MNRILIKDVDNFMDKKVTVKGWVETIRDQKKMQFLVLRDHTGKIQVTNMKADNKATENISKCSLESCVTVTGVLVKAPNVKMGQKEMFVEEFEIDSLAEPILPLDDA